MEQKKKKKIPWSRIILIIICLLVYVISIYLVVVPFIQTEVQDSTAKDSAKVFSENVLPSIDSYTNTMEFPITGQSRIIKENKTVVSEQELIREYGEKNELEYADLLADMIDYNKKIYEEEQENLTDAWSYTRSAFNLKDYGIEDGIVGVLEIPTMEVSFPVYLGATAENMSKGVAQLTETSMPIGGKNTNCVIAGHRGWNNGKFLKDIEVVQEGDPIILTNLWYRMEYVVSEIKLIYPNDIDEILIQPGRDMLTIVTCHPYGTGGRYYRYLLICDRVRDFDVERQSLKYQPMNNPTTEQDGIRRERIILPEVDYFSSEKDIIFDDILHYGGCIMAVVIPVIAIVLIILNKQRNKKKNKKSGA